LLSDVAPGAAGPLPPGGALVRLASGLAAPRRGAREPAARPPDHARTHEQQKLATQHTAKPLWRPLPHESHVQLAPNNPTSDAPGHSSAGPAGLAKRSSPPSPPAPRPLAAVADTGDGERTPCVALSHSLESAPAFSQHEFTSAT